MHLKSIFNSLLSNKGGQGVAVSVVSSVLLRIVDKGLGFVKIFVIATLIGVSYKIDTFYLAFAIISSVGFVWANAMDYVLVPNLIKFYTKNSERDFGYLNLKYFIYSILFSSIIACFIYIFISRFILFYWNNNIAHPLELVQSIKLLSFAVFLYLPYRYLATILRITGTYNLYYLIDLLLSGISLSILLSFKNYNNILELSFLIGLLITLILSLFITRKYFNFTFSNFAFNKSDFVKVKPVLFILLLMESCYQFCDRYFLASLDEKFVTYYSMALSIVTIVPYVVSLSGPFIVEYGKILQECGSSESTVFANNMLKKLIIVCVLISLFVILFVDSGLQYLLLRGRFDSADLFHLKSVIKLMVYNFLPLAIVPLLDQINYTHGLFKLVVFRFVLGVFIIVAVCNFFISNEIFDISVLIGSSVVANYCMLIYYILILNSRGINITGILYYILIFFVSVFFIQLILINNGLLVAISSSLISILAIFYLSYKPKIYSN